MPKSKITPPKHTQRQVILNARRNEKMARSMQSYVRGSTTNFYEWLETSSIGKLPEGPPVWICGDCHFGNLGPVANVKGQIDIQIRDLDQSVIGNPIHDVIRLGLSLAVAARDSDLPGVTTVRLLENLIAGYIQEFSDSSPKMPHPDCIQLVMHQASIARWKTLAKDNIGSVGLTIPLGKRFWPISTKESHAVAGLCDDLEFARLATMLRSRSNQANVTVLDAAYWVKGCSSLGNLRYAVLLDIREEESSARDFCLIDVKEAIKAIAPRAAGVRMPRDNGKRILQGAKALSPYLGDRMLATQIMGRSVCMRELLPEDLKLEIGQISRAEAMTAAKYLGAVVGKAHARQMDAGTRSAWHKELLRNRGKKINAPIWLWDSVVELISTHGVGYLEHCRRYATTLPE